MANAGRLAIRAILALEVLHGATPQMNTFALKNLATRKLSARVHADTERI